MDLKGDSGKRSERNKESWKESFYLLREYINNHEQNADTHIKVKGQLRSIVLWKVELASHKIGYLA